MRIVLFFLLMILGVQAMRAQEFGGHPPAQQWKQIKTVSGRVIYPVGWDSAARRIAGLASAIRQSGDTTIGSKLWPYSIMLQHQTTISNGYVALAPYRSEFYMTPPVNPFDLGSLAWTDQLTLHEFRHLQQYSNFNKGLAKVFRVFLGQQGQALANALTVPDWFFEGDAVLQETFMSQQGRGRMPAFFNGYRSIWEMNKHYSWMKLRNGSLKDYVPNHYQLGYLMVLNGAEKYGPAFWKNVSEEAAGFKGLFYPFQKAVRKYSGLSYRAFIENALVESRQQLGTETRELQVQREKVIQEENPVFTENGELLYLRTSYSELPVFYSRKDGIDRKIRIRDRSLDHYFSYANGQIIYAAYRPATRWSWKDYGEIRLLDIHSGKQKTITRNSKYFTPALSEKADTVVAVHMGSDGVTAIHLLDNAGNLLKVIPNQQGYVYSFPRLFNGLVLTAARNKNGEMAILELDPSEGHSGLVFGWTDHLLGYPVMKGDSILFTLSVDGSDKTMLLERSSGKLMQFLPPGPVSRTGFYQPVTSAGSLVVSHFTANGFKLETYKTDSGAWRRLENLANHKMAVRESRSILSDFNKLPENVPGEKSNAMPYPKTSDLFNFHSWTPFYEDPEFSFTVYSQNLLNTFQNQFRFLYNRNEGFKQFGFSGIFGGWFPWMSGGVDLTIDRRGVFNNRTIYWNELEANAGFQIPLNLSRGRNISYLSAGSELVYNKPYFRQPEKKQLGDRSYFYLNHELRYSHQVQQARQHFHPRWAQVIRLQYRHAVTRFDSEQLLATGNFYTPGLARNHSLVLHVAMQQRDSLSGLRFSNNFPFARGYSSESLYRGWKWGATYHFPLAYPDWGIWNIVYLLRLRSGLFFDHAIGRDPKLLPASGRLDFRSAGTELYFDTKWWNQLPVSFGIRYARLLDKDIFGGQGVNRWQLILPLNLVPGPLNEKKVLTF